LSQQTAFAVVRLPVTESDIDGLGHLNQARYHDFLGRARSRLLRQPFPDGDALLGTFVMAHTELDYLTEVRFADGFVDVRAEVTAVGTRSIHINNEVVRLDGAVAARGAAVMVAWDSAGRHSRLISNAERAVYGG
jgi:acyl-CoA thioesterase FadM